MSERSETRERKVLRRAVARLRGALSALALLAAGAGLALSPADARAGNLEGAYLKARYAALSNDLSSAARFYREALIYDPDEPQLLKPAFYYSLIVGETDAASRLAPRILRDAPGDRLARLAVIASALKEGEFGAVEAQLAADETEHSLLPMTARLLEAWAAFARGDIAAARATLDADAPDGLIPEPESEDAAAHPTWSGDSEVAAEAEARREERIKALNKAYSHFGQLHIGLMEAARGDDKRAVAAFNASREAINGWSVRLGEEMAGALRRLGRRDEAAAIYDEILAKDPTRPEIVAAKASMARGERPEPLVRSAAEGAAVALYGMGAGLRREQEEQTIAVYYLQLARSLKPDFNQAKVDAAGKLAEMEQYELAAELYASVPPQAALGEIARIGRAESLIRAKDFDGAQTVLSRLASEGSARPSVYLSLGQLESVGKRYGECANAYAKALTLMDQPNWRVLLSLGACRQEAGDWPSAEAAFVEALTIEPRQPDVLNHFGYGLVVQGRRLDDAKRMLEIAVEERPDSGYIVDSLGWALYQLGDFKGAVTHLEKAVSLAPSEAVINDHFGDALWKVGRKLEARFQWRRALSFEPTDDERPRIERKLAIGLDKAMAEEAEVEAQSGASPKKVEAREPDPTRATKAHDG